MPKRSSEGITSEGRTPGVRTYTLSDLEPKQLELRVRAHVVHAARMTVTRYSFGDSGLFPRHVHNQEQITYVLDGQLTFVVGDQFHRLCSGDLIVIPAGVPHSAKAGSAGAEVLSVVSPTRRGARPLTMLEPDHRQKR